jgi:hypothetical protein
VWNKVENESTWNCWLIELKIDPDQLIERCKNNKGQSNSTNSQKCILTLIDVYLIEHFRSSVFAAVDERKMCLVGRYQTHFSNSISLNMNFFPLSLALSLCKLHPFIASLCKYFLCFKISLCAQQMLQLLHRYTYIEIASPTDIVFMCAIFFTQCFILNSL